MSYGNVVPRPKVVLKEHERFHLKLMIEFERNEAYFYVEYGGERIGIIQERIGRAQTLYRNIAYVLTLESQGAGR